MSTTYTAELGRLEAWTVKNSSWLALGIVAVAFALRLVYADACYLNPDEAAFFDVARPSRWLDAYEASRTVTHPPLFTLALHGILFFGRTELALRLPSLLCGTAALWLTFAWLRRCLGEAPALAGLGFMALSPAAISASTEVRNYGLLLLFVCGSLYATERALTERSTIWAVIQGLFLVGALLTHYIAVLVIICLGVYVLLRSVLDRLPRPILLTIGSSYLALAMLLGWLYFEHIRRSILSDGGLAIAYLQPYYYSAARDTPLGFAWRAFYGTFYYAVGARHLTFLLILVFLAGLATLLTGRTKGGGLMVLLILSPFAVGFAAAVAHVFPFAGSRHQAYLLPFLAAGIAAALLWPKRGWVVPLLLLGAVIGPLWASRTVLDNDRRIQPMGDMTTAIEYVCRMVPRTSPLFVDGHTFNTLTYYLGRNDMNLDAWPGAQWDGKERIGGYRVVVVVPDLKSVAFRPEEALDQVAESARALGVPSSDPLWIVSTAWQEASLASRLPAGRELDAKEFGRISVIKIVRH
ncbi:MAG: glycosyltransferase family 39 protein [Candidatus Acidiferrum sp.]